MAGLLRNSRKTVAVSSAPPKEQASFFPDRRRGGTLWVATFALLASALIAVAQGNDAANARLKWWRDARFGMFIHWGLYAIPAGEWKGKQVPGIGEWIMNHAQIPVSGYEQLARQFNPIGFDADEWVRTAKAAGQRYMVITAKHHDGFAMFRSAVSKYNVYDATPFHRDVVGELAAACKRQGMPLGFYYSQTQDWHEKDGDGNTWDFDPSKADFDKYFHEKAIPQVEELLTHYGPVALIWFDTPKKISAAQSKELVDLVHRLQPKCLVDGRIGNNAGDYVSTGDNEIPASKLSVDWEVPATLNDTWGFKKSDNNWKSPQTLIRQLVDVVSKNGNYLLNVGPTAAGEIPPPSVERLKKVGEWLQVNGDAVYGAKPSPYPYEFEWGSITVKEGRLFLNVVEWPKGGKFTLYGLESPVRQVALISRVTPPLKFKETSGEAREIDLLLPSKAPNPSVSVVALRVDGEVRASQKLMQQPDGSVTLNGRFAQLPAGSRIKVTTRGAIDNWDAEDKIEWKFVLLQPGKYQVTARCAMPRSSEGVKPQIGDSGTIKISAGAAEVEHTLEDSGMVPDARNPLTPDVKTNLGELTLPAGEVTLYAEMVKAAVTKDHLRLRELVLMPAP